MRNTGSENAVTNQMGKTRRAERRTEAMRTDRVSWFRKRKSI